MGKFFEKKAFFAIDLLPPPEDAPYNSFRHFGGEYLNRIIASPFNTLAGVAAGGLVGLPIALLAKNPSIAIPFAGLGGMAGQVIGDIRTLRNYEDESNIPENKKTTIGKYLARQIGSGIAGTLLPLPFISTGIADYLISRKLL